MRLEGGIRRKLDLGMVGDRLSVQAIVGTIQYKAIYPSLTSEAEPRILIIVNSEFIRVCRLILYCQF